MDQAPISYEEQAIIIERNSKQLTEAREQLTRKWEHGAQRAGVSVALTADAVLIIMDVLNDLNKVLAEQLRSSNNHIENGTSPELSERKGVAKEMWKKVRELSLNENINTDASHYVNFYTEKNRKNNKSPNPILHSKL